MAELAVQPVAFGLACTVTLDHRVFRVRVGDWAQLSSAGFSSLTVNTAQHQKRSLSIAYKANRDLFEDRAYGIELTGIQDYDSVDKTWSGKGERGSSSSWKQHGYIFCLFWELRIHFNQTICDCWKTNQECVIWLWIFNKCKNDSMYNYECLTMS